MNQTDIKTNKKTKGFTIIELIVVISLLSILAAIAGSRFVDINIFKNSTDFEQTLQSIQLAQQLAQNQRRRIYINSNNNRLRLCYIESSNLCPSNQSVLINGKPYEVELTNNLSIPSSTFFLSNGNLNTSILNITIGNQQIVVYGNTGFIEKVVMP